MLEMQGRVAPSLRSSALLCDTPIWLLSLKPMLLRVERRCRIGRQSLVSERISQPTAQERTALLNEASLRSADAFTLRIRESEPVRLPQLACALHAWHPRKLEARGNLGCLEPPRIRGQGAFRAQMKAWNQTRRLNERLWCTSKGKCPFWQLNEVSLGHKTREHQVGGGTERATGHAVA